MNLVSKQVREKLDILQIFRGLAALAVLLHHTTGQAIKVDSYSYLNNFFQIGWSGVNFFFVLSGFIIFYVHYKDIGNKCKLSNFPLKRVIRLFPIYWVMRIGVLAIFFLNPHFGLGHAWLPIPNFAYATIVVITALSFGLLMYKYVESPILSYLNKKLLGKKTLTSLSNDNVKCLP